MSMYKPSYLFEKTL